jgi:hypothetical protein
VGALIALQGTPSVASGDLGLGLGLDDVQIRGELRAERARHLGGIGPILLQRIYAHLGETRCRIIGRDGAGAVYVIGRLGPIFLTDSDIGQAQQNAFVVGFLGERRLIKFLGVVGVSRRKIKRRQIVPRRGEIGVLAKCGLECGLCPRHIPLGGFDHARQC